MQNYQQQQSTILEIIDAHKTMPGNLLPILHSIQDTLGYIPAAAVDDIAKSLKLSKAEVHGVISFYHYFRDTPPGTHTVKICRAEACQSMNGKALETHAKQTLGIDFHETTADQTISLEAVYCLGNCGCAPSITIDDQVYGRVSTDKFDQLIAACKGN